jgi:hypothetical protein
VLALNVRFDTEKAEMERSRSLLAVGIVSSADNDKDIKEKESGCDIRSGPGLPPLTLETTNTLLSPFGSHLRRWFETARDIVSTESKRLWSKAIEQPMLD